MAGEGAQSVWAHCVLIPYKTFRGGDCLQEFLHNQPLVLARIVASLWAKSRMRQLPQSSNHLTQF